ncbi:MAG: Lrp/AsnC family transcriptional regulator [Nitrososphaerota archaeon]
MWEKILSKKFDETDIKIISSLNKDGRATDQKIANDIGISKTAVRTRRLKLQRSGAIRIIALLVLQNMDLAYADVVLKLEPRTTKEHVMNFIQQCSNDEYIYEISEYIGDNDLLLRFFDEDLLNLKEHITSLMDGNKIISSYTIYPVVRSYKAWGNVLNFKENRT